MPFVRVNIAEAIRQKLQTDPDFVKAWEHRAEIRQAAPKQEREEYKRDRLREKRKKWTGRAWTRKK